MPELAIIQKTYDLIKWYVPILNRLPREHKFQLGNRIVETLYKFLESLIEAKYSRQKQAKLESLNVSLSILRYQTRLLFDFALFSTQRYEYVSRLIDDIGNDLGGWLKQLQKRTDETSRQPLPVNS
ncbi:diversity-generating retroelement protein Avd [Tumidithrix elongata RA019]|uniref:Diversity-generating retroelement protein Avd n=1 Tax=Tumidithrix elongata BACA0141 TaxID=2716417 RepID=A0AAW9PU02_9CYAN|nr:diversity-generating retroelement protein Avd [Tumidithrix elongata RA019]